VAAARQQRPGSRSCRLLAAALAWVLGLPPRPTPRPCPRHTLETRHRGARSCRHRAVPPAAGGRAVHQRLCELGHGVRLRGPPDPAARVRAAEDEVAGGALRRRGRAGRVGVPRAACRVPRAACCVLRAACCVLRAACRGPRAAGCGLRAAGCGLRAAGCGLRRAAGCGLRAAGCGLRAAGCGRRRAAPRGRRARPAAAGGRAAAPRSCRPADAGPHLRIELHAAGHPLCQRRGHAAVPARRRASGSGIAALWGGGWGGKTCQRSAGHPPTSRCALLVTCGARSPALWPHQRRYRGAVRTSGCTGARSARLGTPISMPPARLVTSGHT
jgi:hypothetical protein